MGNDRSRNAKHKSPTTFLGVRMGRRTSSSTLHSRQFKLGKRKTVLDIGAGSGIVGLSTLLPLASKVDFKEIGPFATASI